MAHENAAARHDRRTAGEVDVEDCGQQLRTEADREGDGEEQGLDGWTAAQHVPAEDEQHHGQHGDGQEIAEAADAAIELGLRRPEREAVRDRAERGRGAGRVDDALRRSAADIRAEEDPVALCLLDREALAREHCLADEEIARLGDRRVGRDQAAGGKEDALAGYDLLDRNRDGDAVAHHFRSRANARAERGRRRLRLVLPDESESGTRQDDHGDDGSVDPFSRHRSDECREDEQQQERTAELRREDRRRGELVAFAKDISPVKAQALRGLGGRQPERATERRRRGLRRAGAACLVMV